MENNEIMTTTDDVNEEVEVTETSDYKAVKATAVAGAAALVGFLAYKFVVKPVKAKLKKRKKGDMVIDERDITVGDENVDNEDTKDDEE